MPEERKLGIEAGFAWGESADIVGVYVDRGLSGGMRMGIKAARARGTVVEYRSLERVLSAEDIGAIEASL